MLRIYVAGPYRATTEWQLVQNIRAAETVSLVLWSWGHAVFCPHKNTANFGGALNIADDVWLYGGLEFLKCCSIVVVLPGWEKSTGTLLEIKTAEELGILVYYWENPTHRMILKNLGGVVV
jgi:hypothetical protein